MTKKEALTALAKGMRIAHSLFSSEEWMEFEGRLYRFEDGCLCEPEEFWRWRRGEIWYKEWKVVGKGTQPYNLFYSSGGHSGPHENLEAARSYAKRYILGHGGRTSCIEARPCDSEEMGGYGLMHDGSIYIHKERLRETTE